MEKTKMEKVMEEFKNGTLKSSSGETVTSRKQAIAIGLSEAGESKGGIAVVVKSMNIEYDASDVLLMKGKDLTHLHTKIITDKNGKRKTVWVAPVEIPTEHSHPTDKHAQAVALFGAKKKYMSKEKAKEHVARHIGEAEALYASAIHEQDSKSKLPKDMKEELEKDMIARKKSGIGLSPSDIPIGSVHPSNIPEIIEAWKNTRPLPVGTEVKIGKVKGVITGYGSSTVFDIGSNDQWQYPNYHVDYGGRFSGGFSLRDERLVLPEGSDRSYMNGDMKEPSTNIGGGFFEVPKAPSVPAKGDTYTSINGKEYHITKVDDTNVHYHVGDNGRDQFVSYKNFTDKINSDILVKKDSSDTKLEGNTVTMTKQAFEKEHTDLPKILKTGTKAERTAEANDQEKELKDLKAKETFEPYKTIDSAMGGFNSNAKFTNPAGVDISVTSYYNKNKRTFQVVYSHDVMKKPATNTAIVSTSPNNILKLINNGEFTRLETTKKSMSEFISDVNQHLNPIEKLHLKAGTMKFNFNKEIQ